MKLVKQYSFIIIVLFLVGLIPFVLWYKKLPELPKQPPQRPTPVERRTDLKIKSSIPYWDQENAFASFRDNVSKYDYINLFWYYTNDSGDILSYEYTNEDKNIIEFAHSNNVKVLATITNLPETGGWDTDRIENILSTERSRKKHIENIIKKLEDLNFDGVNIDYEEVDASEKSRFTLFIQELATELRKKNMLLSVSLHPKRAGNEGLGKFQDWRKIAGSADQLSIMAFNEHYDEGGSGPVASVPWVEKILAYAQYLGIPPEKIYLGIPFFGYDWNHDNDDAATGLTYNDVVKLIENHDTNEGWDDTYKSPYFSYEEDDDDHEVWYENARSVKEKVELSERTGLGGISFWRLGGEDPKIWEEL